MPGERSNTLQLDSVSHELDGHQLTCEATNSVGTTRLDYKLEVECKTRAGYMSNKTSRDIFLSFYMYLWPKVSGANFQVSVNV